MLLAVKICKSALKAYSYGINVINKNPTKGLETFGGDDSLCFI